MLRVIDQLSNENNQLDIKDLLTTLFGTSVDYEKIYESIKDTSN
ncbi:hypothetical protein V7150_16285 [Neobacillus drentensis]